MKIKSILFFLCLSLISIGYTNPAEHLHPKAQSEETNKKSFYPGYCQIEIYNDSPYDVRVYGEFDDGAALIPFNVYSFEAPHYISLFYYHYCHREMYLSIVTFDGIEVYSGYTPVNSTITIVPYLRNQIKAEVKGK